MKKCLLLLSLIISLGFVCWQIDHFNVTITPNPLKINEAADLKVVALDSEWNIVKDYVWDIYIQEDYNLQLWKDIELPNEQMYTFTPEDQGQKVFSKWTIFKKSWNFEIIVSDIATEWDEDIIWKVKVTVTEWKVNSKWDVSVASPVDWWIEASGDVDVIWSSSLPNSQFIVEVDWKKLEEWITDENWDFVATVSWLASWDHSIRVKILNLDSEVLAESNLTNFKVQETSVDWFKSVSISPSNKLVQMQNFMVTVLTDESVNNVELQIWSKFIMNKERNWVFSKSMNISDIWKYPVSLDITKDWVTKKYENKWEVEIIKWTDNQIWTVTVKQNPWIVTEVILDWEFSWTVEQFVIKYWLNKDDFNYEIISKTNNVTIKDLDPSKIYYAQVYPAKLNWEQDWMPSSVVTIEIAHWSACVVQWIQLNIKSVNWKNYLVWSKVDWASKYIVYKSDNDPDWNKNNMVKVWETTELMFEYPFDLTSNKDVYSFYSVYAQCSNWELQIDAVKKVKVWPMDTLLLMMLISFFFYWMFRLYWFSKEY